MLGSISDTCITIRIMIQKKLSSHYSRCIIVTDTLSVS